VGIGGQQHHQLQHNLDLQIRMPLMLKLLLLEQHHM
jgi:hypothetical protein